MYKVHANVFPRLITSDWMARARALVMGPLGASVVEVESMGMMEGCSASSPLPWERSDLGSKSSSPWKGERSLTLKMSLTVYLMTRARARAIQSEVNSLLVEFPFDPFETWLLPQTETLCVLRYHVSSQGEGVVQDGPSRLGGMPPCS